MEKKRRNSSKYGVKVLSTFEADFIRRHHKEFTVPEFCKLFNRFYTVISNFMNREGLERKLADPHETRYENIKAQIEEEEAIRIQIDRSAFTTYSNQDHKAVYNL